MIDVGGLKKGITIELDNQLYTIVEWNHIKVANGAAQVRLRLKDIKNGHNIEKTFQATKKFNQVRLDRSHASYLYSDDNMHYFMDSESFEQTVLSSDQLGDALDYLKENLELDILKYGEKTLGVELPIAVELVVAETGPSYKGDTAQGGSKPATLETGLTINVPLFINIGDKISIDTRTGSYIERVS